MRKTDFSKEFATKLMGLNEKLKSKVDVRRIEWGDVISLKDGSVITSKAYVGDYNELLHNVIYKLCDISDGQDILVIVNYCYKGLTPNHDEISLSIAKKYNEYVEIHTLDDELIRYNMRKDREFYKNGVRVQIEDKDNELDLKEGVRLEEYEVDKVAINELKEFCKQWNDKHAPNVYWQDSSIVVLL